LFTHLEPSYKNKAWIIVDGDKDGIEAIHQLQYKYESSGWNRDNFSTFTEMNFEQYYPKDFKDEVIRIFTITDKQTKRQEKEKLLKKVEDWVASDIEKAKKAFEESAKEVIDKLSSIKVQLLSTKP